MHGKSIVLSILVLFLFSAAGIAGEEGEQENGKITVRTLFVDGVVLGANGVATAGKGGYRGTRYVLKEGACDGTRAAYDGGKWFVHKTPADHGRYAWRSIKWTGGHGGRQVARTPGYAWRVTKWGLGHLW